MDNIRILIGDVRETLKELPDNSVNCCITSPPYYGLRTYDTAEWEGGDVNCEHIKDETRTKIYGNPEFNEGRPSREETKLPGYYYDTECEKCGAIKIDHQIGNESTPEQFIEKLVQVFREIRRVLTDDGVCFINIGDSYAGSGKGMSSTGATDPKQPKLHGMLLETQTASSIGLKNKDLIGIPWALAFALRADGWYLRQEIIWAKACSGVYSGGTVMPESVKSRFTRSHEQIFMLTKSPDYYFDYEAIAEEQKDISIRRAYSNNNMEQRKGKGDEQYAISGKAQDKTYAKMRERIEAGEVMTRNRRSVWTIGLRPSKVSHFASYPYELVEPMILAGCPIGGTVIDPFGGTGTTAIAANLLGRKAIHCELSQKYAGVIDERRKEIIKQKQTDGLNVSNGKIVKARQLF